MVIRSPGLIALPLALALAACDAFAPAAGPPYYLAATRLPDLVRVGDTLTVDVNLLDPEQRPLPEAAVYWTPSEGTDVDPAISRTNAFGRAFTRWSVGTRAGEQSLVASTAPLDATLQVDVLPGAIARLLADPDAVHFEAIGDTAHAAAHGVDRFDNEIAFNSLIWGSSDRAVASVADGAIVSRGEGAAVITVSTPNRNRTDSVVVTVEQRMVGIAITPAAPVMVLGETLELGVGAVDARGVAMDTSFEVTWASSDESVATVDDDGTVHTHDLGRVTISAASATYAGQATLRVTDRTRPTITAITPAVLAPGDTARIEGAAFGGETGLVAVDIDGVSLDVLAVADGEVTARVPPVGAFPCGPARSRDITVDVDGLAVTAAHPVAPAALHELEPGEAVTRFGREVACNALVESGDYVITVSNAMTAPLSWTGFRLQGAGPEPAAAPAGAPPAGADAADRLPVDPEPAFMAHQRVLQASRELVERRGGPRATPPGPARLLAIAKVGDERSFRIPDIRSVDYCASYIQVTARAVYAGETAVIWEDTNAPLAGAMDDVWAEVGREYDDVMHDILVEYFGDPLVYDNRLDGNGQIFMLFTPVVNDFGIPINGFAWTGDFYDRGECASSNGGEVFYGRVAAEPTDGDSGAAVDRWLWSMRSTVIHEVKHLTAYAHRFDLDPISPTLETTGLEEATARLAEELYGRALHGYGPFENVGFEPGIACELRALNDDPACEGVPLVMAKHYDAINRHLRAPERTSPFGPTNGADGSYYGSGWQLLRWAIDHSGVGEADFLRALVREPSLLGPDNLAARAGRGVADLLAEYSLAIVLDDHPAATLPPEPSERSMPSWNTRDIFAGFHDYYAGTDQASTWDRAWPLATRALEPGAFHYTSGTINGGGIAVFTLDGVTGDQILELLSSGGGPAPGSLGLAVARVR